MEDIPEDVRSQLEFHCLSTLEEVFSIALLPAAATTEATAAPTLMEADTVKVA